MPLNRHHAFASGPVFARDARGWFGAARRARAAWVQFESQAVLGEGCLLGPDAWCVNGRGEPARIDLAPGVICRGLLRVEDFGEGRISLGEKVYIGDDCLLSSAKEITLGAGVLLAHGVQIFDNDSHPVELAARRADLRALLSGGARAVIASAPVRIGDEAWIGFGAIILKGVTIGAGSVVAAGSVVTADVPPLCVAAGNPARVVKELAPE